MAIAPSSRPRRAAALALTAALLTSVASAVTPPAVWAPGEAALQARLLAPCCWNQTLDVHESELAASLRAEIHERLVAGERRDAIEDDLVVRFGERIRAVPKGDDRRAYLAVAMVGLIALAGVLALVALRRLRRTEEEVGSTGVAVDGARDAYDDRLDAELEALGERDA